METKKSVMRRSIAVLAVAGVVGGVLAAGPASAGKFLTKKAALKLFFLRAEAEARFLDAAEGNNMFLDQAEGDARYLDAAEGNSMFLDQAEGDARYLDAAEGNAMFLSPAEGNSMFLDPAEGDARFLNPGEALGGTVYYRRSAQVTISNGVENFAIAACPSGHEAVGGGGYVSNANMLIVNSYPSNAAGLTGFTAWTTYARNNSGQDGTLRAYVVCVNASATDADYAAGGPR